MFNFETFTYLIREALIFLLKKHNFLMSKVEDVNTWDERNICKHTYYATYILTDNTYRLARELVLSLLCT